MIGLVALHIIVIWPWDILRLSVMPWLRREWDMIVVNGTLAIGLAILAALVAIYYGANQ